MAASIPGKALRVALLTNNDEIIKQVEEISMQQGWHLYPPVRSNGEDCQIPCLRSDLILLDLSFPDAIGFISSIRSRRPDTLIVALADAPHLKDLQSALLAGAAAFVSIPLEPNQLEMTVEHVLSKHRESSMETDANGQLKTPPVGQIVSVVSLKGGVGRTTLAVNLAMALYEYKQANVILVEAHHKLSDVTLFTNLVPTHTLAKLVGETHIDRDIVYTLLQRHASGIYILPGANRLEDLFELPPKVWRRVLLMVSELASFVVVDTDSQPDEVLTEVLMQSDHILVVSDPTIASLRSASTLMNAIQQESTMAATPRLVINRSDMPGGISSRNIAKRLGVEIAANLPDDPKLVNFALNAGVPFMLSNPNALLSRRIIEITRMLGKVEPVEEQERKLPSLSRFSSPLPFWRLGISQQGAS
ncbi:MAG: response regulator/pilus assembly protein [Chloroflexi bacterium]|nr:response regulator/pilus assembly protein [Chloroflexota bacterium]